MSLASTRKGRWRFSATVAEEEGLKREAVISASEPSDSLCS